MSEVKHTPGPWIWGKGYNGLYGAGPNNEVLDYAGYEGMWLSSNNQKANAVLIAAAPDLLEALRGLYVDLVANDQDGLIEHVEPMRKARAAIAKAEAKP